MYMTALLHLQMYNLPTFTIFYNSCIVANIKISVQLYFNTSCCFTKRQYSIHLYIYILVQVTGRNINAKSLSLHDMKNKRKHKTILAEESLYVLFTLL